MPLYQHENFGHVQKHLFRKGIITAVDSENDTADVTVPGGSNGSDVPLFYHCEPDSVERGNGAIEGAASAFAVDDEVIVMCNIETGLPVRIIGFVDGLKSCGWLEPWGETLCENHIWKWSPDAVPCLSEESSFVEATEPTFTGTLSDGILSLSLDCADSDTNALLKNYGISWTRSQEDDWNTENELPDTPSPPAGRMVIKVSATATGNPWFRATCGLTLVGSMASSVSLVFATTNTAPNPYFIGDNDGEEMTIQLSDYGFDEGEEITQIVFFVNTHSGGAGWSTSMQVDYINFYR